MRVMLTIIKVFIILFVPVGIGNILRVSKQGSKLFFQMSFQVYSRLGQTERGGRPFLESQKRELSSIRLPPRALGKCKRWKNFSFWKFEIILPVRCCLVEPLTNKCCRTWSSMINSWIDYRACQKNLVFTKGKV